MSTDVSRTVRIGCGAGFWGDSAVGAQQLVESGEIDFLVFDYLAEITMSLLARARAKDAALGYASDFPDVIASVAPQLKAGGIKVISNAGGVNPRACQQMLATKLKALGIELKIAVVLGDDLLPSANQWRLQGCTEMYSDEAFPAEPWSINAYLGAFPIAAALDAGADIVITGRCVDSALALGPLLHEFRWPANDFDRLAGGCLAGHVIECSTQATGGLFTDWRDVAADWDRMGFPIAVCAVDGSFVLTKPAGSGGRVTPQTVAEQIVYEIGDPAAYLLPDVCCDFRQVNVHQVGPDQVLVKGAKGRAPSATCKVSATFQDGFRATGTMMIGGAEAAPKARAVASAILARTRRLFGARGLADYRRTDVEVLGAEGNYGAQARVAHAREVILKLATHHDARAALDIFSREFLPAASSMAQGITGFAGGRPAVTPMVRLFSFLIPKTAIDTQIEIDSVALPYADPAQETSPSPARVDAGDTAVSPRGPADAARISVPLLALAHGRSGDKGDDANIGILARHAKFVPLLREQLTAERVRDYFSHFVLGAVERFEMAGLNGFNFLLHGALGGGGTASLRYDPQGKMFAQMLLDLVLEVPAPWLDDGSIAAKWRTAASLTLQEA